MVAAHNTVLVDDRDVLICKPLDGGRIRAPEPPTVSLKEPCNGRRIGVGLKTHEPAPHRRIKDVGLCNLLPHPVFNKFRRNCTPPEEVSYLLGYLMSPRESLAKHALDPFWVVGPCPELGCNEG